MAEIRLTCEIAKQAPDQRRFWGKAYIHTNSDGPVEDFSGDVVDTPEAQSSLEESFYHFVKEVRSGDMQHEVFNASTLIEGFVVTKEKIAAGLFPTDMDEGIYVGFEANDTAEGHALWDGVKSGRLSQLSIVGEGTSVTI
jgi:hypothetical protein